MGTEFNFNTETEGGTACLSLYDGVVELPLVTGTITLDAAGKEFSYNIATGLADVHGFDASRRPRWVMEAEGETGTGDDFSLVTCGVWLDSLEIRYGVTFTGRETIELNEKLNFVPGPKLPLADVMSMLEFAHGGFNYTIRGNTVELRRRE
jgi:hypothetical protein